MRVGELGINQLERSFDMDFLYKIMFIAFFAFLLLLTALGGPFLNYLLEFLLHYQLWRFYLSFSRF